MTPIELYVITANAIALALLCWMVIHLMLRLGKAENDLRLLLVRFNCHEDPRLHGHIQEVWKGRPKEPEDFELPEETEDHLLGQKAQEAIDDATARGEKPRSWKELKKKLGR